MTFPDSPIVMPQGVTPGGLPYPEDTDAVMLGAQAIKALALAIERPWVSFTRWTGGTLGGSADALMFGWDQTDTNMAPASIEPPTNVAGGFIAPKPGLWRVEVFSSFVTTWPGGAPQMSVGAKAVTSGNDIASQSGEPTTGGNARRDYYAAGLIRVAQGESVRAFQNNFSGLTGLTYAGGPARPNRYSSRFAAWWWWP